MTQKWWNRRIHTILVHLVDDSYFQFWKRMHTQTEVQCTCSVAECTCTLQAKQCTLPMHCIIHYGLKCTMPLHCSDLPRSTRSGHWFPTFCILHGQCTLQLHCLACSVHAVYTPLHCMYTALRSGCSLQSMQCSCSLHCAVHAVDVQCTLQLPCSYTACTLLFSLSSSVETRLQKPDPLVGGLASLVVPSWVNSVWWNKFDDVWRCLTSGLK